jgi:hypothetical protein
MHLESASTTAARKARLAYEERVLKVYRESGLRRLA